MVALHFCLNQPLKKKPSQGEDLARSDPLRSANLSCFCLIRGRIAILSAVAQGNASHCHERHTRHHQNNNQGGVVLVFCLSWSTYTA
mmetsp:Transcript_17484/g.27065  ORF Transcript_17484/g.27065 Transcript_17484/m.27065 type:complete len:87 (-) Transcript_17484:599-859(-)